MPLNRKPRMMPSGKASPARIKRLPGGSLHNTFRNGEADTHHGHQQRNHPRMLPQRVRAPEAVDKAGLGDGPASEDAQQASRYLNKTMPVTKCCLFRGWQWARQALGSRCRSSLPLLARAHKLLRRGNEWILLQAGVYRQFLQGYTQWLLWITHLLLPELGAGVCGCINTGSPVAGSTGTTSRRGNRK